MPQKTPDIEHGRTSQSALIPEKPRIEEDDLDTTWLDLRTIVILFFGIVPSIIASAMSLTIIAASMANISIQLGDTSQLVWMQTSYMLTLGISEQWVSKIRYSLDRRNIFLVSAVIFAIGSAVSGASLTLYMLAIGRAIQGMGSGGLLAVSHALVQDVVPEHKLSEFKGHVGFLTACSYIFGPLLGGFLNDQGLWRWCFYVMLPVIGLSMIVVLALLKNYTPATNTLAEEMKCFDVWGVLSLLSSFTLILLGLGWHQTSLVIPGHACPADSRHSPARSRDPLLPVDILKIRNPLTISITQFFIGVDLFSEAFFLPLYFTFVKNNSAQQCGAELLSFFVSYGFFWIIAGLWLDVYGYFRQLVWLGGAVRGMSIGLLLYLNVYTDGFQIGYLLCGGMGLGLLTKPGKAGAQAAVNTTREKTDVESNLNFWRTIGGMIGIAITGAVFTNLLATSLCNDVGGSACPYTNPSASWLGQGGITLPDHSPNVPVGTVIPPMMEAYIDALNVIFKLWIPMACLAFFVSLFLENKHVGICKFIDEDNKFNAAKKEQQMAAKKEQQITPKKEQQIAAKKEQQKKARENAPKLQPDLWDY
ncbi:major facilitator superfamily domain-containing protein [Jimgerdemannia flammicorona]|uniref:Major facilitator superfamily domain-containing protein n=1 Tax=Jimgerdemannia flammicorona TaxID=994334 RepID=A0A433Q2Z1_9FUNG|nr:major facilitator superfamily domain-containing protein [Jimgerdemannia flammicorona]